MNRHIDECLNTGRSRLGLAMDKKSSESEPWSEWLDLAKMDWYFGNIDRKKAEEILKSSPDDAFLVRKSSREDSYAISLWKSKNKTFTHALIEPHPQGGFRFQASSTRYPSIKDLIEKAPECRHLKPPSKTSIQLDD